MTLARMLSGMIILDGVFMQIPGRERALKWINN